TYLTLHDFGLEISPAGLLAGRLHIRSLRFAAIGMARSSTAPSTTPFTEYLKVPRLPVGVVLDRLSVGRLALAPPVLGDSLVATVEGNARLAGETAQVALDIHRTDDSVGHGGIGAAAAGGVRPPRRRPHRALAARDIRRPDRRRSAVDRNRGGQIDGRWHFWRPR